MTTTKTVPSTEDITNATTLAIAAGRATIDASQAFDAGASNALHKLSLRFSELALEFLGGEAGKASGDEAASA
ncbi:hypothetical protein D3C77_661050 [compost metagenome]